MKLRHVKNMLLIMSAMGITGPLLSQQAPAKIVAGIPVNYEEGLAGTYTLPDPLLSGGKKVPDAGTWVKKRRPEIVRYYEEIQFGKVPDLRPSPSKVTFSVSDKGTPAFNGKAIRKQVTVYFTGDTSDHKMDLLIYLPANTTKPVPLLLNVSFTGNASVVDDPGVKAGMVWNREGKRIPASPSTPFGKLNVEKFIDQGIGLATVYYGDIEPDFKAGVAYGIRSLYLRPGSLQPAADEWGAISAWSWGLSRAMDYFETDRQVDAKRIALLGSSRLGKTVLWTGAHDTRFAVVLASCSGEGGAAISRRNYGETIKHITDTSRYFYQFAANYHDYSNKVSTLPMDAHMLVALMAPRPLLLQTGDQDVWSDSKGEFLSAIAAEPVYKLFGKKGPGTGQLPAAGDTSLLNTLGFYMHKGGHGIIPTDWDIFLQYLKKFL